MEVNEIVYYIDLTPSPSPKGEGWLAPKFVSLLPSPSERGWG
jgi:hypothetical protein